MANGRILAACALACGLALFPLPGVEQVTVGGAVKSQLPIEPSPLGGSQNQNPSLESAPRALVAPQEDDTIEIPTSPVYLTPNAAPLRPYLGIVTLPAERCYLGGEEHGMEIVTIDPGSPAAVAGLQACTPPARHQGALRYQLDLALQSLRMLADAPCDGDLIVAVDDVRVHSKLEMGSEMARLRPGDVVYLTVIRPVNGFKHETLRFLVHVGRWDGSIARAADGPR